MYIAAIRRKVLTFTKKKQFQVPCVATSAKCSDLAHFRLSCVYFWSFCLHFGPFILFYSFNSVNFCGSIYLWQGMYKILQFLCLLTPKRSGVAKYVASVSSD